LWWNVLNLPSQVNTASYKRAATGENAMWDPVQYARFASERARPFHDLLAQVTLAEVRNAADLGCGPGELTRTLAERWPSASVVGIDNSLEMLARARNHLLPGRLRFEEGDLSSWRSPVPLDLLVSNAALQWVGAHDRVLAGWAAMLAPGGVLAVQVPYRFHTLMQAALDVAAKDRRWVDRLRGVGLTRDAVHPLRWYVRCLQDQGLEVNAWRTTYFHQLTGDNPVLEWFKGTALRPLLALLTPEETPAFLDEAGARLREAYPPHKGVTTLPFTRLFLVATRGRQHAERAGGSSRGA
jgi:trans-aconitate 2-methyltransferase